MSVFDGDVSDGKGSGGGGAASLDPATLAFGGAGLAISAAGAYGQYETGKDITNVQQNEYKQSYGIESNISNLEQQVNNQKQNQMELSARRQNIEDFRQSQMARAKGLTNAVGSGNQFSSSAQSGQGNATSMGLFNSAGVNQNLQVGRNIFGLDASISQQKLDLSNVQTQANLQLSSLSGQNSMWGGISNIGGAIAKAAPMLAAMAL